MEAAPYHASALFTSQFSRLRRPPLRQTPFIPSIMPLVSTLSMVSTLVLSAQLLTAVAALKGDAQQIYTEWRRSSYYTQAVQVVNTVGGTATGSYTPSTSSTKSGASSSASFTGDVSAGFLESNQTITFPSSSGSSGSSATITSSSSSGSSTVVTITETEEQQRFDQALNTIAELQSLHPHANFSINTPIVLLTSEEFLAYVNRYAIDPASNPIKGGSSGSTTESSATGMLTADAGNSNSTSTSNASGDVRTSSAASGETIDWQEAGCVTAVKDQGECGACWAFSATAAIESGYCVATGGSLPALSDQQLISCDNEDGNSGCGGGYMPTPWTGSRMSAVFDVGVTSYDSVREDAGAIEDAVRNQPVSIFLYSGSSAFQYYSGGVHTGENCDKTGSHSALAVGFGETDDNVLYWRIKNQWGTSWGEDGYVRVQRRYTGDSEGACGVEMYATWPKTDVSASPTSSSGSSAPSVTAATPSVTTPSPSVTTEAPPVITAAPSVTTTAPTVMTSAPTVTTSAPSVTTATPTSTPSTTSAAVTTTPSATKSTAITDSPSAAKPVQNTVDQSESLPNSSSSSWDSTIHDETVDQVGTSSGSTRLFESVTPESSSPSTDNNVLDSPADTTPSMAQSDTVAGDASYALDATFSPTTPIMIQCGNAVGDASTPAPDHKPLSSSSWNPWFNILSQAAVYMYVRTMIADTKYYSACMHRQLGIRVRRVDTNQEVSVRELALTTRT
ncbi:unnamed protein product [Phytophthora fragariaefolia]|uniref:Unnamed protein product n=1 Tax=Phytophthora fragariaefolia TaxID=1490495 RepID=A0A9W6U884_9STRA|nr:unnamed protein product [Phytophthora fragariaefolia]